MGTGNIQLTASYKSLGLEFKAQFLIRDGKQVHQGTYDFIESQAGKGAIGFADFVGQMSIVAREELISSFSREKYSDKTLSLLRQEKIGYG